MKGTKYYQNDVSHKTGFTLVELAIVLVVIGLLLGMAFKGKTLVDAAKLKSDLNKISKITTAMNVFYAKYDKLPGVKADFSFNNREIYADLIKEGLLVENDFKITLRDDPRETYWVFSGCVSKPLPGNPDRSFWEGRFTADEGMCIFRSYTHPKDFLGNPGLARTAFHGTAICNIESIFDDKDLYLGTGRVMAPPGGTPTLINPDEVDSNWDCTNKANNKGSGLAYGIAIFS